MLTVARPQRCTIQVCAGGNQRISQFDAVAFPVTLKIFAGSPANLAIDRCANQHAEQALQCVVFGRSSARPDFGGRYGRIEHDRIRIAQSKPAGNDFRVFPTRDFDENIGID